MPILPVDRSHESVINDALATLFRERAGLVASSETLRVGARPDIIVRTPDGPVIVEVELEPARTLEADALSRLGTEIDGRKVQVAFAVAVPEAIREVAQQHLQARLAAINMRWQEWRSDGTSGPKMVDSFACPGTLCSASDSTRCGLGGSGRNAGRRCAACRCSTVRVSRHIGKGCKCI